MRDDRRQWEEEAGVEVKAILVSDPPLYREAWNRIKGWYREAFNRAPPPAQVTFEWITAERVELYS